MKQNYKEISRLQKR